MKRAVTFAFVLCCLMSLSAQSPVRDALGGAGKAVRLVFEQKFPPDRTYAVVIRGDLPTISQKSRESGYPIEVDENGWKGPGSMFRGKIAGTLAVGEVMKLERVEYENNRVDLRLVSVEPHEIVVDADRPDRNRREPVATLLTVPHRSGLDALLQNIAPYVHLFASLDEARAYARDLHAPQPDRRFTLGVVRRDGILVPIAVYDNGNWFRRWPLPAPEREVPIGLDDVPGTWWGVEGPAAKWTMWTPDGKSRPLQVSGPLAFGAHCLMNVGLRTDFRSPLPKPPLDQHHYPKDGIATTGSLRIEPVSVITAGMETWTSFDTLIRQQVNRLELPLMPRLPLNAFAERVATFPKLEVLCLADGEGANTLTAYFEAAKRYNAPDPNVPNPCGAVTFVHGWVHRKADGTGVLDRVSEAQVSDCSMWDVDFRKPLGVVRVNGAPVWILETSRWGGERYDLVQVKNGEVSLVLSVPGGACSTVR